jgi:nitroreductase
MQVYEAIRAKRAIRTFTEQPLPKEDMRIILNAGRLAQSSKNMQAWHFIAISDRDMLRALSKMGQWAGHLAGAALGVAIVTPDPDLRFNVMFDAGQAAAYMQLAAWERGIGSCLATIYERDQARSLLKFPPDLHIRIAISFGYPVSPPSGAAKKTGRRDMDNVVHWQAWNPDKTAHNPFQDG